MGEQLYLEGTLPSGPSSTTTGRQQQHHNPEVPGTASVTTVIPLKRLWARGLERPGAWPKVRKPVHVKARTQTQGDSSEASKPQAPTPPSPGGNAAVVCSLPSTCPAPARYSVKTVTLQQQQRQRRITYDVVSTVGAGVVLQQPRVHALPVKAVSTGDDPQLLGGREDTQPEGRAQAEGGAVFSSAVFLPMEPGVDQGAQFTVAVPRGSPSPSLATSGLRSLESGPTHGF